MESYYLFLQFGIFLLGILFAVTFLSPKKIEASAKGFVKIQIEEKLREKQQALNESAFTETALKVAEKLGLEKGQIQSNLDDDLPGNIASVINTQAPGFPFLGRLIIPGRPLNFN